MTSVSLERCFLFSVVFVMFSAFVALMLEKVLQKGIFCTMSFLTSYRKKVHYIWVI